MEILADKLRPKNLDEIIGQQHLVGKNVYWISISFISMILQ